MIKKVNIYVVLGFLFIFYLAVIGTLPSDLLDDEVFYYTQAQNMRDGELLYFENTQPLLYPAILAVTFSDNIFILRILNAIIMMGALFLLYKVAKQYFSESVSLLTICLVGVNIFTVTLATRLFTEGLFLIFMFLAFLSFDRLQSKPTLKEFILFGVWMGLAIESRTVGVLLPFIFFLLLFTKNIPKLFPKRIDYRYIYALGVSLLLLVPYLLAGGKKFIIEKLSADSISYFAFWKYNHEIVVSLFVILPIVLLIFLVPVFINGKYSKYHKFLWLAVFYAIPVYILVFPLFRRHFFPSLVLLLMLVAYGVEILLVKLKKSRVISYLLYAIIIGILIYSIIIPFTKPFNFYRLQYINPVPDYCIDIGNGWNYSDNFTKEVIDFPKFDQLGTGNLYAFKFAHYNKTITIDEEYKYLIIGYVSYWGEIFANDKKIGEIIIDDVNIIDFNETGTIDLYMHIKNNINIGGVGQVLLCKKVPPLIDKCKDNSRKCVYPDMYN